MRKTPEYIEKAVIDLYLDGLTMNDVVFQVKEEYDHTINTATCCNILKRNGVAARTHGGIIALDTAELKRLRCEQHLSLEAIASLKNVSLNTVKFYLKKDGTYSSSAVKQDWDLNHAYFSEIDTEAKAYILGYLLTDGNVFKPKGENASGHVRLEVSEKDRCILELMKKEFNSVNKILEFRRDARASSTCCFSVVSNQMFNDLAKYGVIPNKTYNIHIPKLDGSVMNHFIRGMFDGDGSIILKPNGANLIDFCGTYEAVSQLQDILCETIGISKNKIYQNEHVSKQNNITHTAHTMWWTKEDLILLTSYLYKDAHYFLQRKYDNAYALPQIK